MLFVVKPERVLKAQTKRCRNTRSKTDPLHIRQLFFKEDKSGERGKNEVSAVDDREEYCAVHNADEVEIYYVVKCNSESDSNENDRKKRYHFNGTLAVFAFFNDGRVFFERNKIPDERKERGKCECDYK